MRTTFLFAFVLSIALANGVSDGNPQDKNRTVKDWNKEQDSLYREERKLPLNQLRLGRPLRELIQKMKAAGITRENAKSKNVMNQFSTHSMIVDSVGRISVELHLSFLKAATLDNWNDLGVVVEAIIYPQASVPPEVIIRLKQAGTFAECENGMSYITISCFVPFDALEKFAKVEGFLSLNSFFPRENNIGATDSRVDTQLGREEQDNRPRSWRVLQDSIASEEAKLPRHLRILERPFREWLLDVRMKNVTKNELIAHRSKYLPNGMYIDSLGRIQLQLFFQKMDVQLVDSLLGLGVKIQFGLYNPKSSDSRAVDKLRSLRVNLHAISGWGYLYADVPFGIIEEVAKLSEIIYIRSLFQYTTVGG